MKSRADNEGWTGGMQQANSGARIENSDRAALFDLDGVIVDTAKYHYKAWQKLARELGFEFTEENNEHLKGVSRMKSLEILLACGGLDFDMDTRVKLAEKKNLWYREYLSQLNESELLPGAEELIRKLKAMGIKTAIASASKNTPMILDKLNIRAYFDVVVDGNKALKAKPDPQVFLMAAAELGVDRENCVVFEDAVAGIQAARAAGMFVVGVGRQDLLCQAQTQAHRVVESLRDLDVEELFTGCGEREGQEYGQL